LHNPWWEESFDIEHDIKLLELSKLKYKYEHPLLSEFPIKEDVVLTLRGPRRIGKTTLIKQIIRKLIKNKIQRSNVFYLPCDRIIDFNELFFVLQSYIEEKKVESSKRLFLFLDEISFVTEWQRSIKSLADSGFLKNTTLLITGSNFLDLKTSSERLPGRTGKYFEANKLYLPLNFYQFYELLNPDWDGNFYYKNTPKLKKYFKDYLLVGGFPNVINEFYSKNRISPETYETYIKWIDGDIYKSGKSLDNAYKLFREINKSLTSKTSYTNFAKKASLVSQRTVQDYIELFEMIFVSYKAEYFSIEQRKSDFKKNKKFYFLDPFIHNAVIAKENGFLDDAFNYSKNVLLAESKLNERVEEVVGASLRRLFSKFYYGSYGKKGLEVDFVGFKKGVYKLFEVKYGNFFKLSSYKEILENTKDYKGMMIMSKALEKQEGEIEIMPVYKFLSQEMFRQM